MCVRKATAIAMAKKVAKPAGIPAIRHARERELPFNKTVARITANIITNAGLYLELIFERTTKACLKK